MVAARNRPIVRFCRGSAPFSGEIAGTTTAKGTRMSITRKLVVGSLAVAAAAVGIAKMSGSSAKKTAKSTAKKVVASAKPALTAAKKATRKPRQKAKAAVHAKHA
jgi:hypothetical protein